MDEGKNSWLDIVCTYPFVATTGIVLDTACQACPAAVAVPRALRSELRSLEDGVKSLLRRHCMSTTPQIFHDVRSIWGKTGTEVRG